MSLFLNLYLGHLLGDFLFQPGRLVLAKRDGVGGLLLHTLLVGLVTTAVFAATLRVDWASIVLVTGMHLCIERLTIMTYVKTSTRGLFTLLFDQTLHLLSIALVVWLAGDWSLDAHAVAFGLRVPIVALAALDGLLTVMLLGSILAFETGNALLDGEAGKGRVLRFDASRIAGMLERGIGFAAALAISPLAAPVAFAPRVVWALTRARGQRARPVLEAVTGLVLCAVMYAAVTAVASLTGQTLLPGS
ncbi:MAG: DUF3307 domain-containing protein [Coriobacteriia bacterium]|nr:DUF3307 domain-containing protein [Coriobacteriia bacterium]